MPPHPSLTASSLDADPVRPVETMAPYEPCWCRSGTKYKWCHFRREQQTPINIFEVEAQILSVLREGYCSHPDPASSPCSGTIAKAHTVQRKGGLAAIAEDGHVLTLKPTMQALIETEGNPSPRKIGIGKASVFPGFCSTHDSTLFKSVEGKSLSLDKDTAFLFAYRAIAYERFAKEAQLRSMDAQRDMDRGHPFWNQAEVQKHLDIMLTGIRIGMQDTDRWKAQFDEKLLSGNRNNFHFMAVRFDRVLPVVACCAFHPEFDFQGRPLQRLGRRDVDLDHIALTVTTFEARTIMIFGWVGNGDGPAKALAESYLLIEDDRKADALLRLLFVQTDNLFLRPSWWDALSTDDQNSFNALMKSGTTMRMRTGADLIDDQKTFVAAAIAETLYD